MFGMAVAGAVAEAIRGRERKARWRGSDDREVQKREPDSM